MFNGFSGHRASFSFFKSQKPDTEDDRQLKNDLTDYSTAVTFDNLLLDIPGPITCLAVFIRVADAVIH